MPTIRELITKIGFEVDNSKLTGLNNDLSRMQDKIRGATRGLDNMANTLIGVGTKLTAFVTLPIVAAGVFAVKAASDIEQLNIAFSTMLGSEEAAVKLTNDLTTFAAKTPFTIPGIMQTAKQLLAMSIPVEDLIPTLKALGDVSSAVGGDLSLIAKNYGQVRTVGKLRARDLNDFSLQGINLTKELAKQYGITEDKVAALVSAGKIGFKDVEKAFVSMSSEGGFAFNLMEKQSMSFLGILSNVIDNAYRGAAAIGKIAVEALKLKQILLRLNSALGFVVNWFVKLPRYGQVMIIIFALLLAALGPMLIALGMAAKAFIILSIASAILNVALLPLILKFALIAAVLASIGLLFAAIKNDVETWMGGEGNSIFGMLFGDYEELIRDLKQAWEGFADFLDNLVNFRWKALFTNFTNFLFTLRDTIKEVISDWRELFGMTRLELAPHSGPAAPGGAFSQQKSTIAERLGNDFSTIRDLLAGRARVQNGMIVRNEINNRFDGPVTSDNVRDVGAASSKGAEEGTRRAINDLGTDSVTTEAVK